MKLLVAGRSGTGKDYLKEILERNYGWKFVLSHTTRKPRFEGENTHVFITREEAAAIPPEEKVATTLLNNGEDEPNEYFTTRQQVEECDAYIIDPNGIDVLLKNMPDEVFEIVYIQAESKEKQKEIAIARAQGDTKAEDIFEKRYASEDEQFTRFETSIEDKTFGAENCKVVIPFTNDYEEDSMKQLAFDLNARRNLHTKLGKIVADLKATNGFYLDDNDNILVAMKYDESDEIKYVPQTDKQYVQSVLGSTEGFAMTVTNWLRMPTAIIGNQNDVKSEKDITLEEYVTNLITPQVTNANDIKSLTANVCDELVNDDSFYEMLDNYINQVIQSHLSKSE